MFMGISVIWDREFGFMKEILVAPISRTSVFIGKMLGGSTDAVAQGSLVFLFGFLVGVRFDLEAFLLSIPLMIIITFGLVSIGLVLASVMESLESFGVIQTFVNLPIFFLSGALFPLEHVPKWLQWFSIIDPLTYGVDALRTTILKESWTPLFPIELDILVILAFDGLMIIIGTLVFNQRK